MTAQDLALIKYGTGLAISFYVIKELVRMVFFLLKTKKNVTEQDFKQESRERIRHTDEFVRDIKEPFWESKNQIKEVHEVVTCKMEGVPLVYNKQLQTTLVQLNHNIGNLTGAINDLKENCKRIND